MVYLVRWSELTVQCSNLASEAVGAILQDAAGGFTSRATASRVILKGWLPENEYLEAAVADLAQRLESLPGELLEDGAPALTRNWIDEEDWAEAWKAYWKAVRIGRRLVIKPTWQPWPPADEPGLARPDDLLIELDPGMAFGTGAHPTTALCLAALEDYARPGMTAVDLGCGSGILTVAALKLGVASVLCLDTDPLAVSATQTNCAANGVSGCEVCLQAGLEPTTGRFDLIVGNISYKVIKQQAVLVPARLNPGGLFIASGFYIGYEEDIVGTCLELGLEIVRADENDMWSCVIARRP